MAQPSDLLRKVAEPGAFGDAYPGETPQYQNDLRSRYQHDPAEFEPGSGEYKFFYGGGQLHVSPIHDHDELRGHAGIAEDHTGPLALGYASVDRGNVTWHLSGNVSVRGFHRILKEYTKQVGWTWGGLTDLDGEPIHDDFAPKKTMVIRDNETDDELSFVVQGNTAYVGHLGESMANFVKAAGYKVAEYPGGGDMNTMMDNYTPMGETLDQYNTGENSDEFDKGDDIPTGAFKCPNCSKLYHNWQAYILHKREEQGPQTELPAEDGKFPRLDLDKPLPPHYHDRRPFILPLASVREASAYEDFEDYSGFLGINDRLHTAYGAYRDGEIVGFAILSGTENIDLIRGRSPKVCETLVRAIQVHRASLVAVDDALPGQVAESTGFVRMANSEFRWAAEQQPKDAIDRPIPFIYDIKEDNIVVGRPGQRTTDIAIPGQFTPGGIVEGEYEPGGRVHIHTMTNMPYSTRHLMELWYWSYPHMQITGLELHDNAGNTTKLAKISKVEVGSYIKTLALTDPAVWNAYKALHKAGGEVYVVGGAVRDALLQKEPKDIDLMVTGLPSEDVNATLAGLPGRVDLTGKNFGVYRYRTKDHEVEIAIPRTERSTGDKRVDFDVNVDHTLPVEDDLLRRDFTVNSMAVNLETGDLIDPYGGADDIEHRRLHTTHPSSFQEDPTRLLRSLVMAGRYGLHPDERTRQEIAENAHRLSFESPDALQPILEKLFHSHDPARAIRLAQETGLLKYIFPEIHREFDFDQNNPHHKYTLGEHLLNVLENTASQSKDPDLRLAALLHDIGKPASAWTNPETGFNHYYRGPQGQGDDHALVGAQMAEERLKALRWPTARTKRIKHLIEHHMFSSFGSSRGARKFLNRVGDEHADDLMVLRYADMHGKGQTPAELAARTSTDKMKGIVEQVRSNQQPTSQSALVINGNDIVSLGVTPGPNVGVVLRRLTDDVIEEPSLNDRDALLTRAKEYIQGMP